jgi:hypothetical protein
MSEAKREKAPAESQILTDEDSVTGYKEFKDTWPRYHEIIEASILCSLPAKEEEE